MGFEGVNNLPLFDERQYLRLDKQLPVGVSIYKTITEVNIH